MNLKAINEFRAAHGLAPVVPATDAQAQRKRAAANKAAHAQLQRDIRAKRNSRSK